MTKSLPTTATVATQAQLDAAVADPAITRIEIRSDQGVWLTLRSRPEVRVVAWGSSRVEAWGSSSVEARESSRVEAWGSDWRDDHACGGGLHLSPIPAMARDYFTEAERYLRCTAAVEDLRVIDGNDDSMTPKVKVRSVRVEAEVDLHRQPVEAVEVSLDGGR